MTKKTSSVTPKADREAALFAAHYEKSEHITIRKGMEHKLVCKCGCKTRYGMSTYSFHRGSDEIHLITDCGRSIWVNLT